MSKKYTDILQKIEQIHRNVKQIKNEIVLRYEEVKQGVSALKEKNKECEERNKKKQTSEQKEQDKLLSDVLVATQKADDILAKKESEETLNKQLRDAEIASIEAIKGFQAEKKEEEIKKEE